MKLLVGLCKYCVLQRKNCIHYNRLHEKTKQIEALGVLTHHCPIYYETIPVGTRVSVEIKEYEPEEDTEALDYGEGMVQTYGLGSFYPKWISRGWVNGTINGRSALRGFYSIKLDKAIEVGRPDGENRPHAKMVTIETTSKRANEIRCGDSPKED